MDCLFCKIARREVNAEVVYEDDAASAFLDIHPRAPGHTVVVPKTHTPNLLEMPSRDVGPFFIAVKTVTQAIEKALAPQGFTIGINHGKVSGQVIEHLHIHIIPRFEGDGGGSLHIVVQNPPQESLSVIASRIRQSNL